MPKKKDKRNKRNTILNHKDTIHSVIVYNEISCSSFTGTSDSGRSSSLDEHHDHVITGDL